VIFLRRSFAVCTLLVGVLAAHDSRASCIEHPWTAFPERISRLSERAPLFMLSAAAVAPVLMSPTGFDRSAREFALLQLHGRYDAEGASVAAPFGLGAAVVVGYGASLFWEDCESNAIMSRATAAMGVSIVGVTALKFVTGRSYLAGYVPPGGLPTDVDRSQTWKPFSELGAWPSGHAAVTFAFAAVVREQLHARPFYIRFVGYALAGAVSFAMAYGDHHWASDLVSGALIGESVGRAFGEPSSHASPTSFTLVPSANGAAIVGSF